MCTHHPTCLVMDCICSHTCQWWRVLQEYGTADALREETEAKRTVWPAPWTPSSPHSEHTPTSYPLILVSFRNSSSPRPFCLSPDPSHTCSMWLQKFQPSHHRLSWDGRAGADHATWLSSPQPTSSSLHIQRLCASPPSAAPTHCTFPSDVTVLWDFHSGIIVDFHKS